MRLLALLPWLLCPAPLSWDRTPPDVPHYALTFDAHEAAEGAEEVLTLLRQRGVRVTLFVTGRFAQRFPHLLRQAHRDGHEIGNHTFSHPRLTTYATNGQHHTLPQVDREFLHRQLLEAQAAITAALGAPPSPLWRAPYGEYNRQILGWAAELGLIHVDWTRNGRQSLDALDWVHDPQSPRYLPAEALARRLVAAMDAQPGGGAGAIVLMHLASRRPEPPLLLALPLLLDELDRKGLRPIPVGELLRPQLTKCGENATPWAMAPP